MNDRVQFLSWRSSDRSREFDRRMKYIEYVLGLLRHAPEDPRYPDIGEIEDRIARVWAARRAADVGAFADAYAELEACISRSSARQVVPALNAADEKAKRIARIALQPERQKRESAARAIRINQFVEEHGLWFRLDGSVRTKGEVAGILLAKHSDVVCKDSYEGDCYSRDRIERYLGPKPNPRK